MTNQQAINLLKGLEQSLDDYCELNDEGKTAFYMAIEALEVFGNSEKMHDRTTDGQIVRCRDCTWKRPNTGPGYCTVWHRDVDPDGYCHKGAGRDGTWKRENRQENSSNV